MSEHQTNRRFFKPFTYLQTFILICFIFFLSLLPIVYFWVITHLQQIESIDQELIEIEEASLLKKLFTLIEEHRFYNQLLLLGNLSFEPKFKSVEKQIQETVQQLIATNEEILKDPSSENNTLWHRIDPKNLKVKWRALTQSASPLTIEQNESLHSTILHNLQVEFAYLTSQIGSQQIEEKGNYMLAQNISLRLPFLQENASLLALIKSAPNPDQKRIKFIEDRIAFDSLYLNQAIDIIYTQSPNRFNTDIADQWLKYTASLKELTALINLPSDSKTYPDSLKTLIIYSQNNLMTGSILWDLALNTLKEAFLAEKVRVYYQLWFVLLLTLLLGSVAFFLGVLATRFANARLTELTAATENFTNGNLSVRVPETIQDEIGHQARAFNRMAQKLEEMISFLFELLGATRELSEGNFSARLPFVHKNKEFDQVALSFNTMAESFETIIDKLQQLSTTLTTSAVDITTASLEQETMIVGQEATTREIAFSANTISSTAKEFASTINNMNKEAEQTSKIAVDGKDSLYHMEGIMHQMVDSSSVIASKLTVLNEKASNITSIITTITKIADQTNILSLNASIEAEKAGEYGKSFSVIAREVRRLADQTANATLDIEKIIHEIIEAVTSTALGVDAFSQDIREGVRQIRQIGEQQTKIIEQVQAFTSRFEKVNQGMQEQSSGAEKINRIITQLSEKTKLTSEAVLQLHQTIQKLRDASTGLRIMTNFISSKHKIERKDPSNLKEALIQELNLNSNKQK